MGVCTSNVGQLCASSHASPATSTGALCAVSAAYGLRGIATHVNSYVAGVEGYVECFQSLGSLYITTDGSGGCAIGGEIDNED